MTYLNTITCKSTTFLALIGLIIFLGHSSLCAQWKPVGIDLEGSNSGDELGTSVAISGDGGVIVAGAPRSDANGSSTGQIKLYRINGDSSSYGLEFTIDGVASGDFFGSSVAVSDDGNLFASGAPLRDDPSTNQNAGAVQVFNSTNGGLVGNEIIGPLVSEFGTSVALDQNGSLLAVGAPLGSFGGSGNNGTVHLYTFNGTNWISSGDPFLGPNTNDRFGTSVALSDDGNTLAIGSPKTDGSGIRSGLVEVYRKDNLGIWNLIGNLQGENENDEFGSSVSLSSDGLTLAVGAPFNDVNNVADRFSNEGEVKIFALDNNGTWVQKGSSIAGDRRDQLGGNNVSLSNDGLRVAAGAKFSEGKGGSSTSIGQTVVYNWDGAKWVLLAPAIDGERAQDESGTSVALAGNANSIIVAIGALKNDPDFTNGTDKGQVRVFEYGTLDKLISGQTSFSPGWRFVGNPSLDQTLASFFDEVWTQGINGADISNGSPNVMVYDESNQQFIPVSDLNTIPSGLTGHIIYLFQDEDALVDNNAGPDIDTDGKLFRARGGFLVGNGPSNITASVSNTDVNNNNQLDEPEGWNLLANPYPNPISVDGVIDVLENGAAVVNQNIFIWNPNFGSYTVMAKGESKFIAPLQAFFVRDESEGSNSFTFRDDMRADVIAPGTFKSNSLQKVALALTIQSEDRSAVGVYKVKIHNNAAIARDKYDAYHLQNLSQHYINLYSTHSNHRFVHDHLPAELTQSVELPLVLETTFSGTLEMDVDLGMIPNHWQAKLTDMQSSQVYNLRTEHRIPVEVSTNLVTKSTEKALHPSIIAASDIEHNPRFILTITPGVLTDFEESPTNLPQKFTLEQNFPNPFNPITTIRYALPVSAQVRLEVYDITGRLVSRLVNRQQSAGLHRITFDASALSSGLYLYRIEAGDFVETRKLTLVK